MEQPPNIILSTAITNKQSRLFPVFPPPGAFYSPFILTGPAVLLSRLERPVSVVILRIQPGTCPPWPRGHVPKLC